MKRLSSEFYELTRNACWRAFWYKKSLLHFLKCNGISNGFLNSWQPNETKVEFLSRLFQALESSSSDKAMQSVLSMARDLSERQTFLDWEGRPDGKESVSAAKEACTRLKREFVKVQALLNEQRRVETNKKAELERANNCKRWNAEFDTYASRFREIMSRAGSQRAGYDFEDWLYDFSKFNELDVTKSYKDANGRQIDGTITIDGTTLLVEAKCTQKPVTCEEVDVFLSKVERKAENTRGVMISVMGFDVGAIKNASRDKTPIVLMDGGHFFCHVFSKRMSFADVIRRLLQYASQTGEAYLPSADF